MMEVSSPPEYANTTFSRMIAPHRILLVPYNGSFDCAPGGASLRISAGVSCSPATRDRSRSLRLNFLTHDCSLSARCAYRCPAVKVKLLSECACGSPPGQKQSTLVNRSRQPLLLLRDAPAGSA